MIYSFRAECPHDVDLFLANSKGVIHIFETKRNRIGPGSWPDVSVEIETDASQQQLLAILDKQTDSHIMIDTLRAVPLAENSLERAIWMDESKGVKHELP